MKKLIVLALLVAGMIMGSGHLAWAQTCSWNSYGGVCYGGPQGTNCTWNAYGGVCY